MTATQLKVMVAFTGAWVVLGWGIAVWEQGSGDGGAGIIAADLVDRGAGGRGGSVAEEDVDRKAGPATTTRAAEELSLIHI